MAGTIKIHDALVQNEGKRIVNLIEVSPLLQPSIWGRLFWVEYDRSVADVPLSILNIPALSTMVHFTMAISCDILMGEADKTYLDGIAKTCELLRYHPGFSHLGFESKVYAKPVVNKFGGDKKGLLFSGGADSTASYIAHKHENPTPIFIHGIDMPLEWKPYFDRVSTLYENLDVRTITSNTEEIYGHQHEYLGKKLIEGYLAGYSFSINRLGICAPFTVAEGIGDLMMSSTYPSREYGDSNYPWSCNRVNWIIDEYLSWADVHVHDVEQDYSTTEKISQIIKPHFDKHGPDIIRSCGHVRLLGPVNTTQWNCCKCDKCQRVIGSLAVSGVDPRTCGFPTIPKDYEQMRLDLENVVWNPLYLKYHWQEVQRDILDEITEDFGGSKAFLEWLRDYTFPWTY